MKFAPYSNNGLEIYSCYLKFALVEIRFLRRLYQLKYAMFYKSTLLSVVYIILHNLYLHPKIVIFNTELFFVSTYSLLQTVFMLNPFGSTSSITNVKTISVQKNIHLICLNVFFCAQFFYVFCQIL